MRSSAPGCGAAGMPTNLPCQLGLCQLPSTKRICTRLVKLDSPSLGKQRPELSITIVTTVLSIFCRNVPGSRLTGQQPLEDPH